MGLVDSASLVSRVTNYLEHSADSQPARRIVAGMVTMCGVGGAVATAAAVGWVDVAVTTFHYSSGRDFVAALSYSNLAFLAASGGLTCACAVIGTVADIVLDDILLKYHR